MQGRFYRKQISSILWNGVFAEINEDVVRSSKTFGQDISAAGKMTGLLYITALKYRQKRRSFTDNASAISASNWTWDCSRASKAYYNVRTGGGGSREGMSVKR
jgi:hypothetical protein